MSQDPYLPPGVTNEMIDREAGAYERPEHPCDCEGPCDCDGPCEEKCCKQPTTQNFTPGPKAVHLRHEKAHAHLSGLPGAKWLPFPRLVEALRVFGYSENWAIDVAREWMKENSKLVRR